MYSIYFANTLNNWSLNASFKIERNTLTSAKENSFSSPPSWISLLSASMKIIMFCQLRSVELNSCTLGCKIHHNGYIEQGDTSWCWFKRMNNLPASHICLQSKVLQNLQPPLCQVFFWLCIFFNVDKHRIFNCTGDNRRGLFVTCNSLLFLSGIFFMCTMFDQLKLLILILLLIPEEDCSLQFLR